MNSVFCSQDRFSPDRFSRVGLLMRQAVAMKAMRVCVLGSAVMLSGCGALFGPEGYFRDRGDDYLKAQAIEPIRLPPEVNSESIGQLFVIPPIADPNAPVAEEFVVPKPATMDVVEKQRDEVKIQKLGERRWITVNAPPSAVWPRVRAFLSSRGLNLAVMDPSMGVLETDWLSIKDDPSNKDRYRIRLEPGLRTDSTEIHILQLTVSQAVPGAGQVNWPAASVNPQREEWMVNELSAFLARQDTTQASMLAQAIGSGDTKVALLSAEEGVDPSLLISLDYARAWASVGGALSRNGFHVEDMNRERGQFIVTFSESRASADRRAEASRIAKEEEAEPQQEPGIFSRVGNTFGMGDDKDDKPDDLEYFNVQLQKDADAVRVIIRDSKGNTMDPKQAGKWLRLIRANLA